ncbi:MAG TPA: PRC-barrel domain-containing protein [Actinomycetota bacterium]|nr:PRC-barrel domain-containing protein [Actinomycetota bacterium]
MRTDSHMTMEQVQQLRGRPVYSRERDKIGTVEHVYYDVERNEPQWLAVGAGILSNRYSMVPLRGASFEQDGVIVPFTKDQVKGSPDVMPDAISQHLEKELWSYYGQHGDWSRDEQHVGYQQPGTAYQQPAQPVQDYGYEQSRIRRWQWEHNQR